MWEARTLPGIAALAGALVLAQAATAQEAKLGVELNKLESFEGGCRSFFLFRNRTDVEWSAFEMSLAILDTRGVIERLLTIDAAPLPANRTTLKLFEIPDLACDGVGTLILHDIAACASPGVEVGDCYAVVELSSLAAARLVK